MAVQRHSPAAPTRNSDPLSSGSTRATDRAYPEPACMWLQGHIPSSDPVAVEAGPLPSPYRRTFLRTRTPAKNVRVLGERTRTPPSRDVRSSPPCSLKSRPKLIIRGAYGSRRQQSVNMNATWRARDSLEVETPKLYRAGCAPAVGSGP